MSHSNKRQPAEVSPKLENPEEWDAYFMEIATVVAKKSKDPATQVGACVVSRDNKIIGTGFNGMPGGRDEDFTWEKNEGLDYKHLYVCHAELNAIVNANRFDLKGCRIYVTLCPCNECAKLIAQTGIDDVIYDSDKFADREEFKASKRVFETLKIKTRRFPNKSF